MKSSTLVLLPLLALVGLALPASGAPKNATAKVDVKKDAKKKDPKKDQKSDVKKDKDAKAPAASSSASSAAPPATSSSAPPVEGDVEAPRPALAHVGRPQPLRIGGVPKGVETALLAVGPAVQACYDEAIAKEGEGVGSMDLRLEIDAPGRVVSATVAASHEISSRLRACARDAFAGIAAGPVGPSPIEVLVPIAFDRDVPDDAVRPASACPVGTDEGGEMTDALRGALKDRAVRAAFCFKRPAAPGESPTLKAGKIEVSMRIAGDGSVCGVAILGDTFDRPSLTSCVGETMSGAYPEKPIGVVDVIVPLEFKGN